MFTLKEYLALEAYYKGNIGVMEMVKFYQKADAEEKIFIPPDASVVFGRTR